MIYGGEVYRISIGLFDNVVSLCNGFVVPLALARVAFANVTGGSSRAYSDIVKGVVLYFVLIFSFEMILKIVLDLPEAFDFNDVAQHGESAKALAQASMPTALMWTLESFASALFYVAVFLNFTFTVILSAIAPVIFILGAVLGIGFGLRAFFGLLLIVSSWPIEWSACDQLYSIMKPVTDSVFGILIFEIVVLFLKTVTPLTLAYFGALSSPVSQAIGAVSGAGVASSVFIRQQSARFSQGNSKNTKNGKTASGRTIVRQASRPVPRGSSRPGRKK